MKIYWYEGSKNIIGLQVKCLRKSHKWTQKVLTEKLQVLGYASNILAVLKNAKPEYLKKALGPPLNPAVGRASFYDNYINTECAVSSQYQTSEASS